MNFMSLYKINYGFFFKERFEGSELSQLQPSSLVVCEPGNSGYGYDSASKTYRNKDKVLEMLRVTALEESDIISYSFSIENGVLEEVLSPDRKRNRYIVKTHLTPVLQELFLKNIFKYFGVYLCIFIKDHEYHITGQSYVLDEFKNAIKKHTPYEVTCGDYTVIHHNGSNVLGIEGMLEGNPLNALDKRKGVTLFLYRDDHSKDSSIEYAENFIIDAETVKRFEKLTNIDKSMINGILESLYKENKNFQLIYDVITA